MTERFEIESGKPKQPVCNRVLKVMVIVFVITVIAVGLMSGLLSAKHAREQVEEKYKRERIEGEKEVTETTTKAAMTTTVPPSCDHIWCNVRLPKQIVPLHYNLNITSFVQQFKYNGTQEILLSVVKPIDVVIFHIKKIKILEVTLKSLGSHENIGIERSFYYPENEYYVTELKKALEVGNYTFTITFYSNVSETLTGYYKSKYKLNGENKVLLTTKFQPTDARRAFPCLDEPDLKATYTITMIYPSQYHARSNMPSTFTQSVSQGWKMTSFGETVAMSPYLICFIVSEFQAKFKGDTNNNVTIGVWSQPSLVNSTEYAFNTSIKMLDFFEDFLGVNYPMPKLDMFAIPDYGSGATEHWGIITYRESRLLFQPGVSSKGNMISTAGIIAHEIAHLWFGNLVTCKWWNDLWVQEGMASYLEVYALNHTHPEWNMIDDFLTGDWKRGITLDAYASSHPISQRVDHPKQIKEIFDSITYSKGASLFQMLDYYLGVEKFKEGLNRYLVDYQYKGATVNDLWDAFSRVTNENISALMDTWTHQMGFPVITISRVNGGFSLKQKHFLLDPRSNVTAKSPYNYLWTIPFTYATSNNVRTKLKKLIKTETDEILTNATWILGNFNHRGFYRVNYDKTLWKYLLNNHTLFEPIDQAGLIDDAFALARAGELEYTTALDMLLILDVDTNAMVWSMAINNLVFLENILSAQEAYGLYRSFLAKMVDKVLYKDKEINKDYMSLAARVGVESVAQYIKRTFKEWVVNGTEIPADVRSNVLYYGVAFGSDKEWNHVFKKFMSESNPSIKSNLQSALSATQKPWILEKWLKYSLNSSIVKTQDTVYVIGKVASQNAVGKYVAWNFVSENWNTINDIAKENNFHVAVLTSRLTSQFTTENELKMTKELWKRYPDAGTGKKAREQGIEKIEANIYWLQKNYKTLEQWLEKNQ